MKKRILLLVMMCLLGGLGSSLMAQETTIKIGNKSTTSQYFPARLRQSAVDANPNYNYSSICQQIYTADEIKNANGGTTPAGKISKIAFKSATTNITTLDKNVKVYMRNVDATTTIVDGSWDTSEELKNNKVYDGSVSIDGNGYLVFNLSPAFNYVEGKNILIFVDNNRGKSGVAVSDIKFDVISTTSKQAAYTVSSTQTTNYGFDANNWPTCSGRTQKNVIEITFSSGGSSTPVFSDISSYYYPYNGSTNIFNPYFEFSATNKTHYKILLSTTNDFSADVKYVAGGENEWVEDKKDNVQTANYSDLIYSTPTTYYWKVIASNGGGADDPTAESDVFSFKTKQISAPGAIEDAYPNGDQNLVNPEFTWKFGENTEEYQILIDESVVKDWTNPGSSTTGEYQTSGLLSGDHTWQLIARNAVDTTYSDVYSFSIMPIPDNVTPVSPVDGATGVTSNIVTFRFAPNTKEYKLMMSDTTEEEMFYITINNGGTGDNWTSTNGAEEMSFAMPFFKIDKTFYWSVKVMNEVGERTETAIYSFTTAATLPVKNVSPTNGAVNLDNPVLKWDYKGAATHYMVYLGTNSNELVAQTDWIAREGESGSYQTKNLTPATTYFWRVDVKDESGNEMVGDTWSFVTELEAPVVQVNPVEIVPSYAIVYGGTTVNWSKIESALGYNVYLGDEKLNTEGLIGTNTNYYEIKDSSQKLNYNMVDGYDIYVEAVYELGEVKSEAVNVKVTGTGFLTVNVTSTTSGKAKITLICTEDEFGNVYNGNGRKYVYETDSDGYWSNTGDGNLRIQNGTYDVTIDKNSYSKYKGEITIKNGQTYTLNVTLKSMYEFEVTFPYTIPFSSIQIILNGTQPGEYHVSIYDVTGTTVVKDLGNMMFEEDSEGIVSCTYSGWGDLKNGMYRFGVYKNEDFINISEIISRNYYVFEGDNTDNSWSNNSNWRDNVVPTNDNIKYDIYILTLATIAENEKINITKGTINITESGGLTINGSLTANNVYNNAQDAALCINDGGQLRQNNTELNGKFVMNIVKPSDEDLQNWGEEVTAKTGWQFISSPVANAAVSQFVPAQGDYDLYKYDGSKELQWVNHKNHDDFETEFVSGRAYLASYNELETATLSGTLNAAKTFARQYSYTTEATNSDRFKNFFLVGNPFTFDMDLRNVTWNNVVEGVAVVTSNGEYEYRTATTDNTVIPVGDGFFIKATGEYPSISYTEGTGSKRSEKVESINVIASSNAGRDNVVINFAGSENEGFPKLQNFNDKVANVYVQNGVNRYGIYNCDRDVNEVELAFVASKMGNYSISLDIDGEFESVVLFDRMTGIETNMLEEDKYSFIATNTDDKNRFVVRLSKGQQLTDDDHFAYQSGEELIVDAEGMIQIVDVMGRIVYSNDVDSSNNRIDVSGFKSAAYIIRNIGDNGVRTQKIVIL